MRVVGKTVTNLGRSKRRNNRGSKPGEHRGGRKVGTRNRKTILKEQLMEGLKISGDDPLTFFLNVYKNEELPLQVRMLAAGEAMPYVNKKMPTAIEQSGPDGGPIQGRMQIEVAFIGAPSPAIVPKPGDPPPLIPGITQGER